MAGALAVVLETGDIADGRIQPDVEVLAGFTRNFEAEVGRVAADVPFLQAGLGPLAQFVGYLGLQRIGVQPLPEHGFELGQFEKEVDGIFLDGSCTRDGRNRIYQLCRCVGGATGLAVVAVLVRRFAAGAGALDKPVSQEQLLFRVESLGDGPGCDVPIGFQPAVDLLTPVPVFRGVGAVEVGEVDQEAGAVPLVMRVNAGDMLFRRNALLFRGQHDRGAVGVIRTDIQAVMPP